MHYYKMSMSATGSSKNIMMQADEADLANKFAIPANILAKNIITLPSLSIVQIYIINLNHR